MEFFREEKAQGLSEYSLILALVVIMLVVAVDSFSQGLQSYYQKRVSDIFP